MNKHFTNRQICLMVYCIIVEYGVINFPKNAVEAANTGAWVSVIIASILFAIMAYVTAKLQYSYEDKTIYEYSSKLIGTFLTKIFTALFIIHYIILFSFISRMYCETINIVILYKTPVKYILLLLFIVISWLLMKGIGTIGRTCEIYATISILCFIILNIVLFSQGEFVNIRPLFEPSHIPLYLKGIPKMAFPLLGGEIIYFLPLNKIKNRNLPKYSFYTILGIGILYIFIIESSLSIVGVDLIVHQKSTVFSIIRGISPEYLEFFKRLDGLYITVWSLTIICACTLWSYFSTFLMTKIFPKTSYKKMGISIMIIAYILAIIPTSTNIVQTILKNEAYVGMFITFVIPIALLLTKKVRKM